MKRAFLSSLKMFLSAFLLSLFAATLVGSSDWCYNTCLESSPSHWKDVHEWSCHGNHQSPIDIQTSSVETNPSLVNFTFEGFDSTQAIKSITNNGHTVTCELGEKLVNVSGGGLNGKYSVLQFHFHWGKADFINHPGSEHTIDGTRYPMEMHIVSIKEGLSSELAANHSEGYAVLGFLINVADVNATSETWTTLTSFLQNITEIDQTVNVDQNMSINGLIGNVDLSKYYRYMGSLTTPSCSETVVWTLFHEPITVNSLLIQMFPQMTRFVDNYRPTQDLNGRQVYTSHSSVESHSWCYDVHHCDITPSNWNFLPDSKCGESQQSPINIETHITVEDESLGAFAFHNFDDKHVIENIINTGHSVQCNLNGTVKVSGGGLQHEYAVLQFHFHWGNTSHDGSEHLVDSKRFPMEMHIVCKRTDINMTQALDHADGLAVLGFFIEATATSKNSGHTDTPLDPTGTTNPTTSSTSDMIAWKNLTSLLDNIKTVNAPVTFPFEMSIDDLLGNVDRHSYFRYDGSLTTPLCNEVVVWTVFKEAIKVDQELMDMFPSSTGYENIYRPVQSLNDRKILTTKATSRSSPPVKSAGLFYPLLVFVCVLLH